MATSRSLPIPAAFFLSDGRFGVGEGDRSRNRCADVYNLSYSSPRARFCSSPVVGGGARVCSPAIDGGARLAGSGGAIHRRIRVLSGGTDGSWIFSGGVAMRYVRLSFAAKGNRIFLFPCDASFSQVAGAASDSGLRPVV